MIFCIYFLILVLFLTIIINIYIYIYKKQVAYKKIDRIKKCEYAIIPGAKIYIDRPCNKLEDRMTATIELYNNNIIDKIIVSGGYDRESNLHEVDFMKKYLIEKGINSEDIIKDYYGINTYSTMYRVGRFINKNESVIICTQKMYAGRSLYLASKLKLNACCYIADKRIYKKKFLSECREYLSRIKAVVNCNIYKKKSDRLENIDFKI